jgi:uncharacterized protein YoxC
MTPDNIIAVATLLILILLAYIRTTAEHNRSEKETAVKISTLDSKLTEVKEKTNTYMEKQGALIEPWPTRMDRMEGAINQVKVELAVITTHLKKNGWKE